MAVSGGLKVTVDPIEEINIPKLACNEIPNETKSLRAQLALNLYFEQRWFLQDILIGDLMSSLALAPLEKIKLFIQRTQRKHFEQNTLDLTEEMESFDSTLIDNWTLDKEKTNLRKY